MKSEGAEIAHVGEPTPWTVRYSDGSGNATTLSRPSAGAPIRWRYDPVQPATSSSGVYSGGAPAEGALSEAEGARLWAVVASLEVATSLHVADRAMGTSRVAVTTEAGERSTLLRAGAAAELEALLAAPRAAE